MSEWGYTTSNGPEKWMTTVPAAKGSRQSPIDFKKAEVKHDGELAQTPLSWSYKDAQALELVNTSHSVQVNYKDGGSSLKGGPLNHKHEIAQFHLHWGRDNSTGSEHTVEGKQYIAELHLVHWNTELFGAVGEAASQDNGLCVLGMFLKIGKEHPELKKIIDHFEAVLYGGEKIAIPENIDPGALLPANTADYWTYPGSLTTPPLFESVTWVVFKEPIEVSEEQMAKFRALREYKRGGSLDNEYDGHIIENYRPPRPVGNRTVRSTFTM